MKSRKVLAFITSLIFCNSFLVTPQVADVVSNSITTYAGEMIRPISDNISLPWHTSTSATGELSSETIDDVMKIVIVNPGGEARGGEGPWDCRISYDGLNMKKSNTYRLKFSLTASNSGKIYTNICSADGSKEVWHNGNTGDFYKYCDYIPISAQQTLIMDCEFQPTDDCENAEWNFWFGGGNNTLGGIGDFFPPGTVLIFQDMSLENLSNNDDDYKETTTTPSVTTTTPSVTTTTPSLTITTSSVTTTTPNVTTDTEPKIDTSNPKINPTDSLIYISNGDFNRDGQTNVLDYISFKNKLLNNSEYPQEYDINGDEIVNIKDLFLLKRQILNSMPIYRMISDNTVQLKGIANNTKNISKIQCDWYSSHTPDKINSVDIEVHNDDFWYTDVFEISSGNNCVNITYTYKDGSIKNETYILQKVTDEIVLNDNVKLINPDTVTGMNRINSIYDSIIDMYVDTMQTDDVSDDETILIVTKDSPLLGSISTGEISQDDIIYIPSCDKFINGLSLIYVSQDSNYDASTYGSDYVAIHTKQASIVDVISNEDNQDIFISYDSIDVDSISWIPYEYDDNIINQYYNPNYVQEASAFSLDFQNVQQSMGFHLATTPNESKIPKAENKNLKKGWNLNNFIHSIYIDKSYYGGSNLQDVLSNLEIVIGNNEAIIYDGDGDVQTTNDQLKGSVEFSIDNVKPSIVLETHNGTLGATCLDQFMCKLNYDKSFKVNINGEAEVSLSDVFGDDNEDSVISLANKENKKAIELTGLDLSDKFILGMISMDITGQIDTNYMTSSDEVASVKPKVFIMLYMDLNGEISASLSLDYNYKSTETFGFNLQNKKYNGKYGSYDKNKSNNENNNYSVGDYGLTFYDGSDSKTLINNFNGEVSAELHTSMGANLGVGVSLLNIIPVLGHVGVKFDGNFSGTGSITYDAVNKENTSADITGNMNVSANFNAGVDCYLGVKAWFIDKEFKKNIYTEAPIFDMGFVTYNGTITSSADGSPVPNATITLTSNGNTFTTTTDDNGEFDMKSPIIYNHIFSDGSYTLKVSADNFDDYIDNNYLISGANSYNDINFELNPKEFSLSGATCDENTNPISDVDVTISTTDNKIIASAITDSDGKFKISLNETTTDGKYLVSFSKQGFETTTKEITIDGITSIGNVTLISTTSIDDNTDHGEITASGTCGATSEDNVNWTLYEDGTMVIDGTGNMMNEFSMPWDDYKLAIKKLIVKYGVTSVHGFYGCTALSSVSLADSIEIIEGNSYIDGAFEYCFALTSINIPSSVKTIGYEAFSNCTALSNVTLNNGLNEIGNYAFSNCTALKNITLPNTLNIIGDRAFCECTSLEKIEIPKSVTSIGDNSFYGCNNLNTAIIHNGKIGINAFGSCSKLENIIMDKGVTSIGGWAFRNCNLLKNIVIPNTVKSIGYLAFGECKNLQDVTISDGVISIEHDAFYSCYSLESIIIPSSVTSIGQSAFERCSALKSVELNDGLTIIENATFMNCASLENVFIPSTVTTIGRDCFYGCTDLININLNKGLINIDGRAFYKCESLIEITIPSTVVNLGDKYATDILGECSSLEKIIIEADITSIDVCVCSECGSLKEVTIPSSVTSISDNAFYECPNLSTIYGESGSYAETWANEQGYTFVAI